MQLEDHHGDVIRKSRIAAGVAAAEMAAVAGLSTEDYALLEGSGRCAGEPDYVAIAKPLGLDGQKLQRLASGWLPQPVDEGRWRHLRMFATSGSGMTVNCFLIWDDSTREAAVFDTGWDGAPLLAVAAEHQLDLKHLFITHSHTDHIAAIPDLRKHFPNLRMHSNSRNAPKAQHLAAGETFQIDSLTVAYRETPGHAEDGVTYVITGWPDDAPPVAVVGDAIFAGSMGGAKAQALLAKAKIREHILSLPSETLICPGHGPYTTVGGELANNPFFP